MRLASPNARTMRNRARTRITAPMQFSDLCHSSPVLATRQVAPVVQRRSRVAGSASGQAGAAFLRNSRHFNRLGVDLSGEAKSLEAIARSIAIRLRIQADLAEPRRAGQLFSIAPPIRMSGRRRESGLPSRQWECGFPRPASLHAGLAAGRRPGRTRARRLTIIDSPGPCRAIPLASQLRDSRLSSCKPAARFPLAHQLHDVFGSAGDRRPGCTTHWGGPSRLGSRTDTHGAGLKWRNGASGSQRPAATARRRASTVPSDVERVVG